jgi:hypothetical protein
MSTHHPSLARAPRRATSHLTIGLVLLALAASVWPTRGDAQRLPTYASFSQVPKSAYRVLRPDERGPGRVRLEREVIIGGLPCRGEIEITWEYGRPRVHSLTLARELTRGGVTYRAGSPFQLTFDGTRVLRGTLARHANLADLAVQGGTEVTFFESGELRKATLARDRLIGGIECRAGRPVTLSRQMRVIECTLARDQPVGGLPLRGGSHFRLFAQNRLTSHIVLAQSFRVGPVDLLGGRPVVFWNTQELDEPSFDRMVLAEGVLASDTVFDGVPCRAGHRVDFQGPQGQRLRSCVLSQPFAVAPGLSTPPGTRVHRDKSGRMERFGLKVKLLFDNTEYPAGHDVHLDGAGRITRVTRSQPHRQP